MTINKNQIVTVAIYLIITGVGLGGYKGARYLLQSRYDAGVAAGETRIINEIMKQAEAGSIHIMTAKGKEVIFVPRNNGKAGK